MTMKSDIEIAQEAKPLPITAVAEACGVERGSILSPMAGTRPRSTTGF